MLQKKTTIPARRRNTPAAAALYGNAGQTSTGASSKNLPSRLPIRPPPPPPPVRRTGARLLSNRRPSTPVIRNGCPAPPVLTAVAAETGTTCHALRRARAGERFLNCPEEINTHRVKLHQRHADRLPNRPVHAAAAVGDAPPADRSGRPRFRFRPAAYPRPATGPGRLPHRSVPSRTPPFSEDGTAPATTLMQYHKYIIIYPIPGPPRQGDGVSPGGHATRLRAVPRPAGRAVPVHPTPFRRILEKNKNPSSSSSRTGR